MRLRRKPSPGSSVSTSALSQPIEVGTVQWIRDLDGALVESSTSAKPVFALFQEVPGCAGCKQFGADVLSDPLLVTAIEEHFVPLLIHNNTGGRDAEVLAAYGEPAWNFQVVRFLDDQGADIIPRKDRVWESGPLATRMVAALIASNTPVAPYLTLFEQEHSDRLEHALFSQSCFWVGEATLGRIDGVVTTEAGFVDRHEVTAVEFDPIVVSFSSLSTQARELGVADLAWVDPDVAGDSTDVVVAPMPLKDAKYRAAPISDQKRQVRSKLELDGLSDAQATKLNSFLSVSRERALVYLSPAQRDELS